MKRGLWDRAGQQACVLEEGACSWAVINWSLMTGLSVLPLRQGRASVRVGRCKLNLLHCISCRVEYMGKRWCMEELREWCAHP